MPLGMPLLCGEITFELVAAAASVETGAFPDGPRETPDLETSLRSGACEELPLLGTAFERLSAGDFAPGGVSRFCAEDGTLGFVTGVWLTLTG